MSEKKIVRGFKYQNNSCYMDTILFILLFQKDGITTRLFIDKLPSSKEQDPFYKDLYNVFCKLYNHIHLNKPINNDILRKLLYKYRLNKAIKNGYEAFHDKEQHDAIEFMEFIMNLFSFRMPSNINYKITTYNRFAIECNHNKLKWLWLPWKKMSQTYSYIYHWSYENLINCDDISIQKVITNGTRSIDDDIKIEKYVNTIGKIKLNRQERIEKITELGKFFVFVVHRENPVTFRINRKKISISIEIDCKRTLTLQSILMHSGINIHSGHYTCLQRIENLWFYYDDMDESIIKKLYSWDKICEKYKPTENGIAFFYY